MVQRERTHRRADSVDMWTSGGNRVALLRGMGVVGHTSVSRNGTLLPIPEGSEVAAQLALMLDRWPEYQLLTPRFPRSAWLRDVEADLLIAYPMSSSADRRLTARSVAPFPLRDGPNVP